MHGSRRLSQDWEKKSMPNAYDVTDEREAVGGKEGAAQQLNQILTSGLSPASPIHPGQELFSPISSNRGEICGHILKGALCCGLKTSSALCSPCPCWNTIRSTTALSSSGARLERFGRVGLGL
jgi:hypothetical protein